MDLKKTLNALVNNFNKEDATQLILAQLGREDANWELEKLDAVEFNEEVFWTIAKDYVFFEDDLTDENYEILVQRGIY
jgi:sulfate adenylyltransferase subunit 1 (EFTu-like GTPase family)